MTQYTDDVFASIDVDHVLERIAGGNETEVYRTDSGRYVVKLKHELGGTPAEAVAHAREMRNAAEVFAVCLGPRHSIPSYYLVSRDTHGTAQVLVMQPFVAHARQLHDIDYATLSWEQRAALAHDLRAIIAQSLALYRRTGIMPDLYGRTSASSTERQRLKAAHMLPWRLWSFLVKRNLLRSHNLMAITEPTPKVILVDYDFVRQSKLYRTVYYAVRWLLFWRDHALVLLMRRGR